MVPRARANYRSCFHHPSANAPSGGYLDKDYSEDDDPGGSKFCHAFLRAVIDCDGDADKLKSMFERATGISVK
jgi:hypothetical protein